MTDPTITARARFRRAAEVEAMQWTGSNEAELKLLVSPFDFMLIEPEDRGEDPDQTAAVRTHAHGGWVGLAPGDWVLKEAGRFSVSSDAEFRTEWTPVPSAPAGQNLRDRIAQALAASDGWQFAADFRLTDMSARTVADYRHNADAVLAALQEPGDRAAVLDRVREWVTSDVVTAASEFGNGYREAQRDIRDLLDGRRMADEAQQAGESRG